MPLYRSPSLLQQLKCISLIHEIPFLQLVYHLYACRDDLRLVLNLRLKLLASVKAQFGRVKAGRALKAFAEHKCPIIPIFISFYTLLPSSSLRSPFYFIKPLQLILLLIPSSPPIYSSLNLMTNSTPNSLLFSTQNILRLPIHYPLGSKGRAVPRVVCCAIPIARAAGKVLVVTSRKQPNNWLCK